VWQYKVREWVKVPGENRRLPRLRDDAEVMSQDRLDLSIVTDDVWLAAQARLKSVRVKYTRNRDGSPKGRGAPGRQNTYLLSGLLYCGVCGGPMIINGGTSARYFRCSDHARRGTCANGLCVKEGVARERILAAIRDRLSCPEGIARARKRLAERLGEFGRTQGAEVAERRQRLARTEQRIARLVQFIADGDRSDAVVSGLHDLEAQAKADRAAIAELGERASLPIRLPTPDEIVALAFDLERRLDQDPVAGREWLRRILRDERLVLTPQSDGVYLARGDLLPLMLLPGKRQRRPRVSEAPLLSRSSGGALRRLDTGARYPPGSTTGGLTLLALQGEIGARVPGRMA
jgi:site-specific DNA recombinase